MILKLLSKGEKRDKMKRTIQALAMLIAITLLAVWMVGCGGEDEGTVATVTGVVPASGETVAANAEITITFDNPVTDVTVNGEAATGSGKTWKYKGTLQASNAIAWTNEDESAGEGYTVSYTVEAPDTEAPTITGSEPANGDKNLDPEEVNSNGITVEFSEAIKKVSIEVTVEGEALKWTGGTLSDDKKSALAEMLSGGELPYEAEIVVTVTAEDGAGNKLEGEEIKFTTAAKEE
jgi:hypothetical protein